MQTTETYQAASANHFLMDEIYAPHLDDHPSLADVKAQQHLKAINELHRYLESSCDCV